MNKLKMQSENLVDENVEKIAKLFPNCVTEGKDENGQVTKLVDFDLLKQELSKVVVDGNDERYTLNWAGKKQAILTANSPINATLRPCREESVDFDNTKNLYIEGDNLDVLKLLRETYLNKIKMIYIDPPYNTGNDFVYNDDFASSSDEYLQNSKSYDEDGNRMVQNLESNGRFHSDWLSMMYPRLKLARDLLTDDGCVAISLDDNEQSNLIKICDEIFGNRNRIAILKILSNPRGRQSSEFFAESGEYVTIYAKNANNVKVLGESLDDETIKTYNKTDEFGKRYRDMGLRKRGADSKREDSPTLYFPIYYNIQTKDISTTKKDGYIEIIPKLEDGSDGRWRWSKQKVEKDKSLLYCREVKRNNNFEYDIFEKSYLEKDSTTKSKDFWIEKEINYDRSSQELRELFDMRLFDYAKPLYLIKKLLNRIVENDKNTTILDFFSGSATTAHAVMQLNAEDGGNRKFIMVQLPEKCDEKSEAYKAGYKNICEIGKERIRRAGQKIAMDLAGQELTNRQQEIIDALNSNPDTIQAINNMRDKKIGESSGKCPIDIGFRVLKLDSSNMKDVYYSPSDTEQTNLLDLVSNIKEDRSPEDLLFQVMLDMGVILSSEIKTLDIKGKKVFNVNDGNLVCCFDENLTDEVVTEIAKMQPLYAVFRDSSMSSDSVAVNFDQIFDTYSPSTTRKII
ncbi:MAG TPA: site-specific DNA-methyltransferase [Candidatus Caccopulliclostridium gallistercoris]|uniref:Site-specific DNA-methyltransferase n=1 Tax=Candidatus Caccopulliclostridium gallistercoris TaxID=2840719 RepID=A0A9D1NFU6_9FIRM|nr:site-specific DNA-methyltransferase [Candidatus Caccopulliclostridium gallistercoris]